jgi:Kef-type K+ transport system membrane component KefB
METEQIPRDFGLIVEAGLVSQAIAVLLRLPGFSDRDHSGPGRHPRLRDTPLGSPQVGAVLAASDPAILVPLFDDIRLRPRVAQTVIAESGFNDLVGTVFALAVAGAVASGEVALSGPAFEFVQSLFLCTLIRVVAGVALSYLVSTCRGGERRESPAVTILAVVALGYFLS